MPKLPDARTPFLSPGGVHSFIVKRDQLQTPKVDATDAPNLKPASSPAGLPPPRSTPVIGAPRSDSFEATAATKKPAKDPVNSGRPPATPHLVYWGGKVLTQPKVANVFVGDFWNSDQGKADAAHMNGFSKTFGKSPMFDMLSPQYGVGRPEFGGSTVVPGTVQKMNKEDVEAAVKSAVAAGGGLATDPETLYTIHLPPGAVLSDGNVDSTQGLGGYHGSYLDPQGKPVYYVAIAYSDGQNGIPFSANARDNNTITLSHELVEAITDPDVAQARKYGDLGYMDPLGGEIGDLAVNDGAMPLNEAFGRDANGYAVQVEWDNNSGSFGIGPVHQPKIITTTGNNPINAKLDATSESQSKVALHSAVDITKLMMTITLDNPKGGKASLTLTSPSGQAIPINLPPVPNFHGSLDLSPFIAGNNAKGNWVLSATDPSGSGITLKNWGLKATGIAEGTADVKQ